MNLKCILFRERSQSEKSMHCRIWTIWLSGKPKSIERIKTRVIDQWLCFVGGGGKEKIGCIGGIQGMFNLSQWSILGLHFWLINSIFQNTPPWNSFYICFQHKTVIDLLSTTLGADSQLLFLVYSPHHELLKLIFTKVLSLNSFISIFNLLENSFISMVSNIISLLITPKFIFSGW